MEKYQHAWNQNGSGTRNQNGSGTRNQNGWYQEPERFRYPKCIYIYIEREKISFGFQGFRQISEIGRLSLDCMVILATL